MLGYNDHEYPLAYTFIIRLRIRIYFHNTFKNFLWSRAFKFTNFSQFDIFRQKLKCLGNFLKKKMEDKENSSLANLLKKGGREREREMWVFVFRLGEEKHPHVSFTSSFSSASMEKVKRRMWRSWSIRLSTRRRVHPEEKRGTTAKHSIEIKANDGPCKHGSGWRRLSYRKAFYWIRILSWP